MMLGAKSLIFVALLAGVPIAAAPNSALAAPSAKAMISAADEAAIGAALDGVYSVISGPAGQARDWTRMRTLFTSDARLTAIGAKGIQGGTVDDYIAKSGPSLIRIGFTERELARRVEIFGDLAHAWSSYEGTGDGGKLKVRGINSIQLVRQNDRWLVQSIFWQHEGPARPLPADMLHAGAK
jgi:hypothetical protein